MKCLCPQEKTKTVNGVDYTYKHRCGQCKTCCITIKQEKAARLCLEAAKYPEQSLFITLTYAPEHLPESGQIIKAHQKAFTKRLKTYCERYAGVKIRYGGVFEYGDESLRPHMHIAVFGLHRNYQHVEKHEPDKKKYLEICRKRRFVSVLMPGVEQLVLKAWQYKGTVNIGEITPQSAAYIAGYVTKKMTDHKKIPDGFQPEYFFSSKSPGIGGESAELIADMFKRSNCYPEGYDNFKQNDQSVCVQWSHMFRVEGRTRPLDRYMRQKILHAMGGETKTETTKALAQQMRNNQVRNRAISKGQGHLYIHQEANEDHLRQRRAIKYFKKLKYTRGKI